jgi:hypothetical protein
MAQILQVFPGAERGPGQVLAVADLVMPLLGNACRESMFLPTAIKLHVYFHLSVSGPGPEGTSGCRRSDTRMATLRFNQRLFSEEEVSRLIGICQSHLEDMARTRHLGQILVAGDSSAARNETGDESLGHRLFTNQDVMILSVLTPRCSH